MHKRIISLFLILALLPMCLAVSAMADEVKSSDQFINVFDYGGINQTTNNGVTLADGSWFYYHIPSGRVRYIDIIFTSTSDVVAGYVSRYGVASASNWFSTTLYELDNNTYRLVSNGYEYGWDNIYVMLDFVDASSRIEVLAFNISYSSFTYQPIEVTGTGVALGLPSINLTTSFPDSPYSNWTYDSYEQYQGYQTDGIFRYNYYISEWNKFDYIDLQLGFIVGSITSISAYIGDQNVPVSVNYLNNSGASANSAGQYYIYITADLTGFNHSLTDPLVVVVNGSGKFQLTNQANIFDACGKICLDNLSPFSYWFVSLESWIVNLRSTLSKKFDDLGTNIGTSITSLATNIESWISTQTQSVVQSLSNIGTTVLNGFNRIPVYLGTQTDAIGNFFNSWGQSLKDSIDSLPDKIAEALKDLVVPADGAVESMATKSEALVSDRFGGVFEGAQIVDNWASQLQAQAATQTLTVPVVKMNILGKIFPIGGWEVDLIPEGFEIIFESVKIIIDILATAAFINGIKSRLERTLEK